MTPTDAEMEFWQNQCEAALREKKYLGQKPEEIQQMADVYRLARIGLKAEKEIAILKWQIAQLHDNYNGPCVDKGCVCEEFPVDYTKGENFHTKYPDPRLPPKVVP